MGVIKTSDTQVAVALKRPEFYIVELRTRGWAVGISHSPEERVLTTIFRLSRKQKNKLQYLKVKFYRTLDKYSVFTLGEKYVVPQKHLPEIERDFNALYSEFLDLRKEIFDSIEDKWDEIRQKLEKQAVQMGIPTSRISKLKPSTEDFIDMYYVITPLNLSINHLIDLSEEFEKLAKERDEYKMIAARLRDEARRTLAEVKKAYEEKITELEKTIDELKKALKEKSREVYRLRLKAREIAGDASEIASFLGGETMQDLKMKLEALKEFFTER